MISLPDPLVLPSPSNAISFGKALETIRKEYMVEALLATVQDMDIDLINAELKQYVPTKRVRELAGIGLRAELVYPVPCVLQKNPRLIAYYRLLLGYSGKRFWRLNSSLGQFINLEKKGTITPAQEFYLPAICAAFIVSAGQLVDGLGLERISRDLLDDLQLLTLGSFLQGAENVKIGQAGAQEVRELIGDIVKPYITSATDKVIKLHNPLGREVVITISSDPDVRIEERTDEPKGGKEGQKGKQKQTRKILAIEIKAGEDFSNIYNRLGEAEKSHLKAKKKGFTEFWTIAGTKELDLDKATVQTPTTNEFFLLAELEDKTSDAYQEFRQRIEARVGIPSR